MCIVSGVQSENGSAGSNIEGDDTMTEEGMAKGDDIEDRLIRFGVAAMDLCESLPPTFAGKHLGNQLLRSATSCAPNYAEARGCESMRDFIHKLGIVLKELNESRVWLKTIRLKEMVPREKSESVYKECDELCRIIAVSRRTAENNSRGGTN
jgi:four helix bundle protein